MRVAINRWMYPFCFLVATLVAIPSRAQDITVNAALVEVSAERLTLTQAVRSAWTPMQTIEASEGIAPLPWPSETLNFGLTGTILPIGDVDGNGRRQVAMSAQAVDERVQDGLALTTKSALLFGEGLTTAADQVLYAALYGVGDMTGNGFDDVIGFGTDDVRFFEGSASGLDPDGVLLAQIPPSFVAEFASSTETVGGFDLDGDGFGDVLLRPNSISDRPTFIGFGAARPEDIVFVPVSIPNVDNWRLAPAVTSDGEAYIVGVLGSSAPVIVVIEVNSARQQELVQSISIPGTLHAVQSAQNVASSMFPFAVDITGDGLLELYLRGTWVQVILLQDPNASRLMFREQYIHFGDPSAVPIGDVDGDGRTDFLVAPHTIRYGAPDLSGGLASLPSTTIETRPGDSFATSGLTYRHGFPNGFGDITGNGLDDVIVRGTGVEGTRFYVMEGASNREHAVAEVLFSNEDHARDIANHSIAVGDVTGNGIDDVMILFQGPDPRAEFYEGGSSLASPTRVFRVPDAQPIAAAGGHFSSQQDRELVLSWLEDRTSGRDHFIEFRHGAALDVFATLTDVQIYPQRAWGDAAAQGIAMAANLGDVTNDGFDNLMVGLPNVLLGNTQRAFPAVLLQSGAGLTGPPVHTFTGTNAGFGFAPLGDINGDGIADFAIATAADVVAVYYGRDVPAGDGGFSVPERALMRSEGDVGLFYMSVGGTVSGDFNGDGRRDIATLGWRSGGLSDTPMPVIHVYDGGLEGETRPSRVYPLPAELLAAPSGSTCPGC
jgi:hypothetical protein